MKVKDRTYNKVRIFFTIRLRMERGMCLRDNNTTIEQKTAQARPPKGLQHIGKFCSKGWLQQLTKSCTNSAKIHLEDFITTSYTKDGK